KAAETPTDWQVRTAEAYYTVKVAVQSEKTGDKAEALRLVREGLLLRERLSKDDAANAASQLYEAGLFEDGADLLVKLNQFTEARKIYEKALQIYSEILPTEIQNADAVDRKTRLQKKIN